MEGQPCVCHTLSPREAVVHGPGTAAVQPAAIRTPDPGLSAPTWKPVQSAITPAANLDAMGGATSAHEDQETGKAAAGRARTGRSERGRRWRQGWCPGPLSTPACSQAPRSLTGSLSQEDPRGCRRQGLALRFLTAGGRQVGRLPAVGASAGGGGGSVRMSGEGVVEGGLRGPPKSQATLDRGSHLW